MYIYVYIYTLIYVYIYTRICICAYTHMDVIPPPNLIDMGWQAPSNYRSLLQNIVFFIWLFCKKRPMILKSLLIVATT